MALGCDCELKFDIAYCDCSCMGLESIVKDEEMVIYLELDDLTERFQLGIMGLEDPYDLLLDNFSEFSNRIDDDEILLGNHKVVSNIWDTFEAIEEMRPVHIVYIRDEDKFIIATKQFSPAGERKIREKWGKKADSSSLSLF